MERGNITLSAVFHEWFLLCALYPCTALAEGSLAGVLAITGCCVGTSTPSLLQLSFRENHLKSHRCDYEEDRGTETDQDSPPALGTREPQGTGWRWVTSVLLLLTHAL